MIQIRATIEYRGGAKEMRRGFAKIRNAVFQKVGGKWHKQMAPPHFAEIAYTRYGFRRREWPQWMKAGDGRRLEEVRPYVEWKRQKVGHNKPMVLRGDMKRDVLGRAEIRSGPRGFRVIMRSPQLNLSSPRNIARGYPDFRDEMTRVTGGEVQRLAEYADKLMTKALRDVTERRVKRI
jgi:hypothetical protein